jgi:hypothetical protein
MKVSNAAYANITKQIVRFKDLQKLVSQDNNGPKITGATIAASQLCLTIYSLTQELAERVPLNPEDHPRHKYRPERSTPLPLFFGK